MFFCGLLEKSKIPPVEFSLKDHLKSKNERKWRVSHLSINQIILTISGIRPSSALGVPISNLIVNRSVFTLMEGDHDPWGGIFNVSRQMRPMTKIYRVLYVTIQMGLELKKNLQIKPSESILGWNIGVKKRTLGGSKGYLSGICMSNA